MSAPKHGSFSGDSISQITGTSAADNVQYHFIPSFTSQHIAGNRNITGFSNAGSAGPALTDQ